MTARHAVERRNEIPESVINQAPNAVKAATGIIGRPIGLFNAKILRSAFWIDKDAPDLFMTKSSCLILPQQGLEAVAE